MIDSRRQALEAYGKVGVLMGGDSAEREISLISGNAVLKALVSAGVNAVGIDAGRDLLHELEREKIERAFIMLHGRKGEDGKAQAALEWMGLPYTGSGVLASALAMDKVRCKKVWVADGLSTPPFMLLHERSNWKQAIGDLGTVFVKPVREGSSIGISRASSADQLREAYEQARRYDDYVIAERWIDGPEFSVAILGTQVLPAIELRSAGEFYDYEAKYFSEETRYVCPAALDEEKTRELQDLALRAYHSTGCTGWGRVDVMQDRGGRFWLLEVNTVPGMTEHSLVPMAASAAGMDFTSLALRILDSSYADRRES